MATPWRDTKGFSFHSICLHVRDVQESSMFYQEVFGMDIVREAELGSVTKVWLQFPADKDSPLFGQSSSLIELVQQNGTEADPNYSVNANQGGFHHLCFSVPDIQSARNRFRSMGVDLMDLGTAKTDILVLKDPDGYSIQILSQEVDKHMELQEACREVVMSGAQQAMQEISEDSNPVTLEEAGMKVPSTAASPSAVKSPSAQKSPAH